jgi:SAM-dependent methyltransferase
MLRSMKYIICLENTFCATMPPNHLRIRIGAGNRIFNGHIDFIRDGNELWLMFLSHKYCTSNSDVVELGCGCGRLARPLRDPRWNPWFEGTYVGVDIDEEMIAYCRNNFPAERFKFILSPDKSKRGKPVAQGWAPEGRPQL